MTDSVNLTEILGVVQPAPPPKRRKPSTTNMQRTLAYFKKQGYTLGIVEKFNSFIKIRQDLYGFTDILGVRTSDQRCTFIQTCSGSMHAEHKAKILAEPRARTCAEAGQIILLVSWSKKGDRGKRKTWEPRVEQLTLGDFDAAPF